MAETKKAKAAKPRPKKAKASSAKKPARSAAKKTAPAKVKRPSPIPRRASGSASSGFDIAKLIDHPLVADLLAVGAMAAVAAIADHHVRTRTGQAESGSTKAVKAAGKAAAAAIGKRLMTEVNEVRKASKPQPAKRGSK